MVEEVYLTRRQREVLREREKWQELEQERQREVLREREKWQELEQAWQREFMRSLEESGVSKEQIEQAWLKAYKPEPVAE